MRQSVAILLATASCWAVAQSTFPTTVEMDLIFPRNETYAPMDITPIVFAFRNSPGWTSLVPQLSWRLINISSSATLDQDTLELAWGINTTIDPYFRAFGLAEITKTEGQYRIIWGLTYGNCTLNPGPGFFSDPQMAWR